MIEDSVLAQRLWSNIDTSGGETACWEWQLGRTRQGYGKLERHAKVISTHRLAWELTNGPIPDGLHVCHHCDNPPCCNPAHLFLGTDRDNAQDRFAKARDWQSRRMHCPRGHPLSGANLYINPAGGRACRECARQRNRAYQARKKDLTATQEHGPTGR